MGRRTKVTCCAALMLAMVGCGETSTTAHPTSATTTTSPSFQEVVKSGHPIQRLDVTDLLVRREGDRIWTQPRPEGDVTQPAHIDALDGLLQWPIPSLRGGTIAVAGGGDGATLFPLLSVVRSVDQGKTWQTFEVPEVDGERGYTNGQVLLADGRLLVIVGNWSDDEGRHPSARHHGFFVSDADNLGRLHPIEPTFSPPLTPTNEGNWACCMSLDASTDPDPVIWTTTWDHRLYYSTDDGQTFTELPLP